MQVAAGTVGRDQCDDRVTVQCRGDGEHVAESVCRHGDRGSTGRSLCDAVGAACMGLRRRRYSHRVELYLPGAPRQFSVSQRNGGPRDADQQRGFTLGDSPTPLPGGRLGDSRRTADDPPAMASAGARRSWEGAGRGAQGSGGTVPGRGAALPRRSGPRAGALTEQVNEAFRGYDELVKQAMYEPGMTHLGQEGWQGGTDAGGWDCVTRGFIFPRPNWRSWRCTAVRTTRPYTICSA